MSRPAPSGQSPELIEGHDAVLKHIAILPGDIAEVAFAHIAGYFAVRPAEYAVWSCEAVLRLSNVGCTDIRGSWAPGAWVTEGELVDGERTMDMTVALTERAITACRFALDSGGTISFEARGALFVSLVPKRVFETWHGPLIFQSPT